MQDTTLTTPKQCRLLGATVAGLGVVTDVQAHLSNYSYAIVWDGHIWDRILIRDLEPNEVNFPEAAQPFHMVTRRVDYGVYDEVYSLPESAVQSALETYAAPTLAAA